MRGRTYEWSEPEQALREWTTAQKAAFALRQKVEKQRWESEVLAPAQERIVQQIQEGRAPVLQLPDKII